MGLWRTTFFSMTMLLFPSPLPAYSQTMTNAEASLKALRADEMLLKTSLVPFDFEDSSPAVIEPEPPLKAELQPTEPSQNPQAQLELKLADLNQIAPPILELSETSKNWIPKFAWVGDINSADELKCVAAFLIGSLSNDPKKAPSPGVFVTPQNLARETSEPVITKDATQNTSTINTVNFNSKAFAEISAGVGFVYFSGVRGVPSPRPTFLYPQNAGVNSTASDQPGNFRGHLEHNNPALFTFDLGYRLTQWVHLAATFQTQQNIYIRSKPLQITSTIDPGGTETFNLATDIFEANLDNYSLGGKLTLNWPGVVRRKNWTTDFYFGGQLSAGWQSWTRVNAIQTYTVASTNLPGLLEVRNADISFKPTTFANVCYGADAGLCFKPSHASSKLSWKLGCKLIVWGATRGLADVKDQNDLTRLGTSDNASPATTGNEPIRSSYFKPLRIQAVYSWAPYLSFKWQF